MFLIHETLQSIGIPPNIYSYKYIIYATELILSDYDYIYSITKCLYVDIASKFKTTPYAVEAAIRHAIHTAWEHGNKILIEIIFKTFSDKIPSNSIFLFLLLYYEK